MSLLSRIRDRITGWEIYDQFVFRKRVFCESDEAVVRRSFRDTLGNEPNLDHPETFCEKIVWLLLHYRPPELAALADKYAVRAYVRERVGESCLNEMLGLYRDVNEVDWDALPNAFALKATHGSKWNIICADRSKLDRDRARREMQRWLRHNFYWYGREWVYRDLPRRIIAERFLDDGHGQPPPDYKLFCFDGIVRLIEVDTDRFAGHRRGFYTPDWKRVPVGMTYPPLEQEVPRPACLQEMCRVASALSQGIPFVRVDLYDWQGRVLFGEMTLLPGRGIEPFDDDAYNREVGSWINLPPAYPDRGFRSRLPAVFR